MEKQTEHAHRRIALARLTWGIVLAPFIGASSFLFAIDLKSGPSQQNLAGQTGKLPMLAEVDRGPRGKHELALTFDGGAEAECFDDLIKALANANAHVSSTFFITGKFVRDHPD